MIPESQYEEHTSVTELMSAYVSHPLISFPSNITLATRYMRTAVENLMLHMPWTPVHIISF
jgi:hypothetical protein